MKLKRRSVIQTIFTILIVINCIIYFMFINDLINFKLFSVGDLNPYGGWSAFKASFIDVSYRWRGISSSIALTISITLASLIVGRFFCSFICPIGALQDFFKYLGKKMKIKEVKLPQGKVLKPEMIKYLVLIIVLILSILGLGNLISPLSPWLAYMNLFIGFNIQIGSIILLLIMILSLFIKRLFCRCLCPLGAFQTLLSAIGLLKIKVNKSCNNCTHCLRACPVDIQDMEDDTIFPECISCLECMDSKCIKGANGYKIRLRGWTLSNKGYILICLILILSIFVFLPVFESEGSVIAFSETWELSDGTYTGMGTGFGGILQVQVTIVENRITDISTILHNETSGYYEEVFKNISRELIDTQRFSVDVISGATSTSRGFINAVRSGVVQAMDNF